ncbi:hypothetical protein AAFF_G00029540 [Aldrovandia affinis]|uniref:Uncharacterized protein n=1 Tax=Aldrovandia affinis TaxID=143900 RepID=A0AAD7S4C5_9TELE|nr:hypothetical protein AAFF_G00029540 [Aldrovandia affinis]
MHCQERVFPERLQHYGQLILLKLTAPPSSLSELMGASNRSEKVPPASTNERILSFYMPSDSNLALALNGHCPGNEQIQEMATLQDEHSKLSSASEPACRCGPQRGLVRMREGPAVSHVCFQDAAGQASLDKSSGIDCSISCAALL